jgi:sec-independent protein translocase protein TatA
MFESPWHWAVVIIVGFILFFGWKQLPDMARSLGRSLRIFKTEIKGMTQDDKEREKAAEKAEEQPPRALPPAQVVRNDTTKARPRPTPNGTQSDSPRAGAQ